MNTLFLTLIGAAALSAAAAQPTLPQRDFEAVSASIDIFSLDLYQVVGAEPGNLVFSPLSAAAVLTLVWLGAGGETARQLGSALRLPPSAEEVADGWGQLMDALQSNETQDLLLRIANELYVEQGFDINESFQQTAVNTFRSDVEELNFRNDLENSRLSINQWVEDNTEGRITDLFPEGSLTANTVLVLVNALYFSAMWETSFEESITTVEPFRVSETQQVNTSMMHGSFRLAYGEAPELDATVLSIPYKSEQIQAAMVIFLPNSVNGLENLVNRLRTYDGPPLQMNQGEVIVSLPKFTIETTLQLNTALQQLGVNDLFGPQANLSGISSGDMFVSQVVQKSFISVNENGTEAAAATGVAVSTLSLPVSINRFNADHPFLFFIREGGVTLFLGRFVSPTE